MDSAVYPARGMAGRGCKREKSASFYVLSGTSARYIGKDLHTFLAGTKCPIDKEMKNMSKKECETG